MSPDDRTSWSVALVRARIAWLTASPTSGETKSSTSAARIAAVIAETVISLAGAPAAVLMAVMMLLGCLLDPFWGLGAFVHHPRLLHHGSLA